MPLAAYFTHRSATTYIQPLFRSRVVPQSNSCEAQAILDTAGAEGAPVAVAQFEDLEDAKDAMQGVNQLEYKGRILTVEYVAREANGRCRICVD